MLSHLWQQLYLYKPVPKWYTVRGDLWQLSSSHFPTTTRRQLSHNNPIKSKLVNHILCGCKCAEKSCQPTQSWISKTWLWRANCKTSCRDLVVGVFSKLEWQQDKQTSLEGFSKCSLTALWWAGWESKEEGERIEEDREGQLGKKGWECWQRRGIAWRDGKSGNESVR